MIKVLWLKIYKLCKNVINPIHSNLFPHEFLSYDIAIVYFIQKQPTEVFYKKFVLKVFAKFTRKHLRQNLFLNKDKGLKETLAQVFSCEFCEIFNNSFLTELIRTTASVHYNYHL